MLNADEKEKVGERKRNETENMKGLFNVLQYSLPFYICTAQFNKKIAYPTT